MKRIIYLLLPILLIGTYTFEADARTISKSAENARRQAQLKKEQRESRYNEILDSRDLYLYNEFISDYPNNKTQTPEIRKRADEINLWNEAKRQNSISSYENYLQKSQYKWYADEAKSKINTIKQEQERAAWTKVVNVGTLAAYEEYLRNNPQSGYAEQARTKMENIKATEEWEKIKNIDNLKSLQAFISKYPNAECTSQAKKRVHELRGYEYYKKNDLKSAYSEFSQLSISDVSYSHRDAYQAAVEYNEFSKLSEYSTESTLKSYLSKYPNSRYASKVNNLIAISKAKNFSDYASDYDYKSALSYARDERTETIVKSYITANKKVQSDRRKAYRAYKRKENGGWVNIGFDFLNLGYNCQSDGYALYYNLGLLFRVGNYNDWVQFAVGIKPGVVMYDGYEYDYDYSSTSYAFHMPLLAQLKFNLFKASTYSRFFVMGQYEYNAVRAKELETPMSWGVGFGFCRKHIEWSLFYRQDIGSPDSWDYDRQFYIGMSLVYYWTL